MKTPHFDKKPSCEKPILRQIEWGIQNGPITKNGVLPVTTLSSWKIFFSLRNPYKELIWCTNHPNIHIHTFHKHWSFIWVCFFPVSIFKKRVHLYPVHPFFNFFHFTITVFSPQYNRLWPAGQCSHFVYPENTRKSFENLFSSSIKWEHYRLEMSKENKHMEIKLRKKSKLIIL